MGATQQRLVTAVVVVGLPWLTTQMQPMVEMEQPPEGEGEEVVSSILQLLVLEELAVTAEMVTQ
jgi:hypothetical protein